MKHLIRDVRTHCAEDLELFAKFVDKGLLPRLDFVRGASLPAVSYTEAVEVAHDERAQIRVSRSNTARISSRSTSAT